MRDRRIVVLLTVGVLALAGGAFVAWEAVRGPDPAPRASARSLPTHRFVSRPGGFSLRVPDGMEVARNGRTARFTARDHSVVVAVGPAGGGGLKHASRALLRRVRQTYADVRVLGSRSDKVDGRRARTTYGRARNEDEVGLRFVVLVVAAKPRSYGITAFASTESDPDKVLPAVDAVAESFHVLPGRR